MAEYSLNVFKFTHKRRIYKQGQAIHSADI